MKPLFIAIILAANLLAPSAGATSECTLVIDLASGRTITETGSCDTRATPASTFKLAFALIGFDAGVLKSASEPKLPFRQGYVDWRGDIWRQATTPKRWLKYSVVWYTRQIARRMGVDAITAYLRKLDYGNADFSGDKGYDNALDRAWIGSSLKISPREQVRFLSRMLTYQLSVKRKAVELTKSIVETTETDGWRVHGKTGLAFPRNADRSFDRARGWGWFVGWATKGERQIVFARLIQDEKRLSTTPSQRAKQSLLAGLPRLSAD